MLVFTARGALQPRLLPAAAAALRVADVRVSPHVRVTTIVNTVVDNTSITLGNFRVRAKANENVIIRQVQIIVDEQVNWFTHSGLTLTNRRSTSHSTTSTSR